MSQKDKFGVALQSAVGTPVTTMTAWPPVTEASFEPNRATLEIDETVGIRVPTVEDLGSKSYSGSVAGAVRPDSFPVFLSATFGEPTTTEKVAATAWEHVYDCLGDPMPLSAFLVYADPATPIVDLFSDVWVNSLEVTAATDDYMLFSADCVAGKLDTAQANPTITSDGTSKFPFNQLGAQISVNGGALTDVDISEFRFRWNNNIELDDVPLGSLESEGATPGSVSIEGSFTVTGANSVAAHYRRVLQENPDNVRIVLTATGAQISGVYDYKVAIDIKRARYTAAPVKVSGSDTLKNISVDFAAYLDTTNAVTITVVNANDGTDYTDGVIS